MNYKKTFALLWAVALILISLTIINEIKVSTDNKIIARLNQLGHDIESFTNVNKRLPNSLSEVNTKDATGIKYNKIDSEVYELCATFVGSKPGTKYSDAQSSLYVYAHKKGYECFKVKPYTITNIKTFNNDKTDYQQQTRDTERQTDIKTLHGQIEAYYAQNGFYPTLLDMNTNTFRSANMRGLDGEALKDPYGTSAMLTLRPARNYYSYNVEKSGGGSCDNVNNECAIYTLTATLESGGVYTKSNLN